MINKGAMVIKGEQDDEEELEDEQLEGAYTNGIQGGEQNIIDEEGDGEDDSDYDDEGAGSNSHDSARTALTGDHLKEKQEEVGLGSTHSNL